MKFWLAFLTALSILATLLIIFETKGWLSMYDHRRMQIIQTFGMNRTHRGSVERRLNHLIRQVNPETKLQFLEIDSDRFIRYATIIVLIIAFWMTLAIRNLFIFPIIVLVQAIMILYLIDKAYQKRIEDFEGSLEEGIQTLITSLQAGMNLVQSFDVVAKSKIRMIDKVFQRMLDEYNVGLSLQAAVKNMEGFIESTDMLFFSQTIEIYYSSGGDVTEILESMLQMMRRRRHMEGDLQAKTSEVRMTANLLIVLPILLISYLGFFEGDMIEPLLLDPVGQVVLTAGLFLWGTGVFVVRKLTNIRTLN
jgi:tight adherence protein B